MARRGAGNRAQATRYSFSLDGGPGRPDPRSRWQPEGVDGPSAVVDQGAFSWSDDGWAGFDLSTAVIYEMHVGTFSAEGTFDGAIEHLRPPRRPGRQRPSRSCPWPRAAGRADGVTTGPTCGRRTSSYGGPEGLKRFVDACHQSGLGVVLDVVYNHLGPAGNYLNEFGPYFTDRYRTPWGWAVNLDGEGSYGTRDFVISNALMWFSDYHVDGLRLDAVHAIFDEGALHILEELSAAVERLAADLGRDLWLIAESDRNDPRICRSREQHGYGIDACWDDDFHHALHTVLTGETRGLLRGFRPDFSAGKGVSGRVRLRRAVFGVPPAPSRPAGAATCRASRSSAVCKTTTRSATGPSASAYLR